MENVGNTIEKLRDTVSRLKQAKESLEIEGVCPESESSYLDDPYNIGFIWASLCNSLHSATDNLNGLLAYVEPGGLKDAISETDIVNAQPVKSIGEIEKLEENEQYKSEIENNSTEKLEDDGK